MTCLVAVLVQTGFLNASPVVAAGWGGYSHAWENSGTYDGMSNFRNDVAVSGLPATGCSSGPYTGDPVYQTMWYALNPGTNYFELGTGHQCQDQYR